MRLVKNYRLLSARRLLFKQGFDRFLKLNQRFVRTKSNPLHRPVLGA